jgi:PPK2 family polyphosphate:nucleotide phosphotransferase
VTRAAAGGTAVCRGQHPIRHDGHMSHTHWSGDVSGILRVGEGFSLADVDPESKPGYTKGKSDAVDDLAAGAARLDTLQERLYAQSRIRSDSPSVLLVLQAMDSAGKGGIIRHVVGSVDPQGVSLVAFKKPTPEELAHDFLWRIEKHVPQPGFIGVFDRSHYEDVLIGSVRALAPADEIERRFGAINDFERRLTDAGTRVVKVMLHISYDEQRDRLMERLDRPDKHWKYNPGDVDERELWPQYMAAYQTVFDRTSTDAAPWHVVPGNRKWYARLAVQALLVQTLEEIDPQWPSADYDVAGEKKRLAAT